MLSTTCDGRAAASCRHCSLTKRFPESEILFVIQGYQHASLIIGLHFFLLVFCSVLYNHILTANYPEIDAAMRPTRSPDGATVQAMFAKECRLPEARLLALAVYIIGFGLHRLVNLHTVCYHMRIG